MGPVGPVNPVEPVVNPGSPCGPFEPVGPVRPVGPVEPVDPSGPVLPGGPFTKQEGLGLHGGVSIGFAVDDGPQLPCTTGLPIPRACVRKRKRSLEFI